MPPKPPTPPTKNASPVVSRSPSLRETKSPIENVVQDNRLLMIIFLLVITFVINPFWVIVTIVAMFLVSYVLLQNLLYDKRPIINLYSPKSRKVIDFFIGHFSGLMIALFVSSFLLDSAVFFPLLFVFMTMTSTLYQFYSGKMLIEPSVTDKKMDTKAETSNDHNQTDFNTQFLPLDINRHARHLRMLLSVPAVQALEELIMTVNELHTYHDYLQGEHAYLAHSVHELIMDISNNSIFRLDTVAKGFVKNGKVKTKAKAVFAKEHEPQIIELFYHHIAEIKALNESILEKQMAGFSQTGTEAERTFRNKIMELKILLKWYIAQQPDELSASNHQVILNRLQNTTLKKMMSAFYDASSTNEQRQQLQQQLDDLLEHFKSQSPMSHSMGGDSDDLLKLTYAPNIAINPQANSKLSPEQWSEQMATQDFIDFNKQYVKQLKQHW